METSRPTGKSQGNPPDCAYYLLLGLCVSATFLAFGGIFTYMGYWPSTAFHHAPGSSGPPNGHTSSYYVYGPTSNSLLLYSIIGPVCLGLGLVISTVLLALAIKFDCNHEPEEPSVLINELASNLNLSAVVQAEPKYELVGRQQPTPTDILQQNPGPSQLSLGIQAV